MLIFYGFDSTVFLNEMVKFLENVKISVSLGKLRVESWKLRGVGFMEYLWKIKILVR